LSRDNPFYDSPPQLGRTGDEVLVELEQVVSGCEKPPFGPGGGSSTSGEAGESAVVLGISE